MNQNVIRGVKVRVIIKTLKNADDPRNMQADDNVANTVSSADTTEESFDYYLSGLYYVKDVIYEYDTFSDLDNTKMSTTLILAKREWLEVKDNINFDFLQDTHFAELKNAEILREKIGTLREIDEFVGKYYSTTWVRKNVLMQSDEDIEELNKEIEDEGSNEEPEDEI